MKRTISTIITLMLAVCLLLGSLPVSAAYQWEEGKLPEGWTRPAYELEEQTATNILAPNNPNASQEAKNLLAYMQYVGNSTEQIITGNFDYQGDDLIWDQVEGQYGVNPALYSTFYQINGSTGSGSDDGAQLLDILNMEQINATAKEHYDDGCILLLFNGSYEEAISSFIIEKGIAESNDDGCMHFDMTNPDRNMEVYALWQRYVNNITTALKDLESRGVKAYLYRHFIEYNNSGRNINGATDEGYEAFIRVQQQFFQAFVDAGLEGFLATWSPSGWMTTNVYQRYPGNDYVDVMSITGYSTSEAKGFMSKNEFMSYNFFAATGKPIGFSEISARTGNWRIAGSTPRSSFYNTLQSVVNLFPRMSYLCAWGNGGYSSVNNAGYELQQENVGTAGNDDGLFWYTSPYAINLGDMPDYKVGVINNPGIAQLFTTKDCSGKYVGLEERTYNAADLKKMGIDIKDIRSIHTTTGYTLTLYTGENATGDSWDYTSNLYEVSADVAKQCHSLKIGMGTNLAFERDVWASTGEENAWKINDGALSAWEAKADDKGEAWIMMDLGDNYSLDYYTLQLAGAGDLLALYNLRDFRIEGSLDGENWTVLDTVTDNTASSITKNFLGQAARYLRLYITKANSSTLDMEKNDIYVCEWEVYGARTVLEAPEEETPSDDPQEDPSQEERPDVSGDTDDEKEEPEDGEPEEDISNDLSDVEETPDTDKETPDTDEETPDTDDEYVSDDTTPEEDAGDDTNDNDGTDLFPEEDTDAESDDEEGKTQSTKVVKVKKRRPVTNWALIYGMIAGGVALAAAAAVVIILIIRKKKVQTTPEE